MASASAAIPPAPRSNLSTLRERLADLLFGSVIQQRVAQAVKAIDDQYWMQIAGGPPTLDRSWTAHKEDLDDALEAWRTNPLARRIVALTTDYVVGSGIYIESPQEYLQRFIDEFWRLNHMPMRLYDWCDELTRCGELFLVLRTEAVSGQSFVRAVPASRIDKIETDPDDLERELRYHELVHGELQGRWWPSRFNSDQQEQIMLHYAINRPIGCLRGDSDLQPLLPWLKRYRDWLENRVRLNKYKTAFLWDVTIAGRPGRADTLRKKRFKYRAPPEPGSIIVHDEAETWQAVSPKIEAWDAKEDGKAIRLMVAAGAGIPLHFLSEGETATRATAAEMGDPTFRHYYRRQLMFGDMLKDLLTVAYNRARARGRGWGYADLKMAIKFPDITKRDNQAMAQAALMITRALETMARCGWIDKQTAIEMALRFAGELVDVKTVLERLEKEGPTPLPQQDKAPSQPYSSVTGTGEPSERMRMPEV